MTMFKGRYATGVIVGSYRSGGLLEASVEVTANHGGQRIIEIIVCYSFTPGYFTFRLCPLEGEAEASQACMDNNVLGIAFIVMDTMPIIQVLTLIFRIQQSITLRREGLDFST